MYKSPVPVCLSAFMILILLTEGSCAIEEVEDPLNSSDVLEAGVRVSSFIEKNQRLPENVSVGNRTLDTPFCAYALSRVLTGSNLVETQTINAPRLDIRRISVKLTKKQYMEIASKFRNLTSRTQYCPETISFSGGRIDFYNAVYLLSKIGRYRKLHGKLPDYVQISTPLPLNAYRIDSNTIDRRINNLKSQIKKTIKLMNLIHRRIRYSGNKKTIMRLQSKLKSLEKKYTYLNGQLRYYEGLRVSPWYVPSSLRRYIRSTAYCNITDPNIVYLARELSGNTTHSTALNLFSWVRDNVDYSFYYRTRYGASGTLRRRTGNCVDQAHLMVALARTSGIPARYVRRYCRFISGNWYSHVWAQLWIRGRGWVTADTTHTMNTLGHVYNWNTSVSEVREVLLEYDLH
ncbi:pseudomurein-binding protein [Methanothermobacter sp. KEPCO-1]|uniref:transglutaminase domain-containing protein n=1 Tax=Methanothermobacter sp. KEPCO-1 TaxID=2603820 RepID=UPI0011CCBFD8|nr:transglutaminase domain-containing protein [Methanothermobacter sp. KEPCO-1]QEF95021.1 pseudomurein-binding protein [Methanothermobacter sp. KEPCO-1]